MLELEHPSTSVGLVVTINSTLNEMSAIGETKNSSTQPYALLDAALSRVSVTAMFSKNYQNPFLTRKSCRDTTALCLFLKAALP
jgi:hypothetical protein